jgi:hypothetical protein
MRRRDFLGLAGAALISAPKISLAQTTSIKKLRVVVVANRNHEADGLMAALCNQMAHSHNLSAPYNVDWPRWPRIQSNPPPPPPDSGKPRCLIDVFKATSDTAPSATMEIWCIDDLADTKGDSGAKVTAMDKITNYGSAPDGVVAFGTAGYPGLLSNNGCATIGGTVYIHDATNDVSGFKGGTWAWSGYMDTLVPSKTPGSFFTSVAADQKTLDAIGVEMIAPQIRPAGALQLFIASDAVGISSVNIPYLGPNIPPPYCDIDSKAVALAEKAGASNITSIETTHGVIRSKWKDAPFIYVTAIPNRICHFPDEASQKYAQEFPSSHNAGVALKYVMPYFVSAIA